MYVCFQGLLGTKNIGEAKLAPYGRVVDNTFLKNAFNEVRLPMTARYVIIVSIA